VSVYDALGTEGLFAELNGDPDDVRARIVSALGRLGAADWILGSLMPDPTHVGRFGAELQPSARAAKIGVAEAWELAHALAEATGGDVEPMFAGDIAVTPPDGAREAFAWPTDEGEPPSVGWHLDALKVDATRVPAESLREIVVHQPDTGWTSHPELGGDDPVGLLEQGQNFVERGTLPRDPMTSGPLRQPGHGTATASVLGARPKTTVAREDDGVMVDLLGVAPSVTVVPIRVTESVIILGWQRRLAEAIEWAVSAGARVISMSLGGIGGSRLERACRLAEASGVIVVCAAGNYYPCVVAPASYSTVIAVAAIGPDGAPWRWSARGDAVTISAPGHRVWVAGWSKELNPVARLGSGTSFATACVAGAAALWLARHGADTPKGDARVPGLFRAALDRAATPIGRAGYGAGMLDVGRLLDLPLSGEATDGANEVSAFLAESAGVPAPARGRLDRERAFHDQVLGLTGAPSNEAEYERSAALRASLGSSARTTQTTPAATTSAQMKEPPTITLTVRICVTIATERE
jgi:subtilisin family serine protease